MAEAMPLHLSVTKVRGCAEMGMVNGMAEAMPLHSSVTKVRGCAGMGMWT
jgi:hypothetical protein